MKSTYHVGGCPSPRYMCYRRRIVISSGVPAHLHVCNKNIILIKWCRLQWVNRRLFPEQNPLTGFLSIFHSFMLLITWFFYAVMLPGLFTSRILTFRGLNFELYWLNISIFCWILGLLDLSISDNTGRKWRILHHLRVSFQANIWLWEPWHGSKHEVSRTQNLWLAVYNQSW